MLVGNFHIVGEWTLSYLWTSDISFPTDHGGLMMVMTMTHLDLKIPLAMSVGTFDMEV
jgi:hypothetical protein